MRYLLSILLVSFILSSSTYAFADRVVKVKIDSSKTNGKKWDTGGGAPDVYIKVDGVSYRNKRCQDAYYCSFYISERGSVTIEVWDADMVTDDYAGETTCNTGEKCYTRSATVEIH